MWCLTDKYLIMATEKSGRNPFKVIVIVLASVAVVLAGVLAWIWIDKAKLVKDLTIEKEMLTQDMIQLKTDYRELMTDNDSLNMQLEREQEKVEQLIERVRTTEATNRARIRDYEKELGTLRDIMKHYIKQIDSLNTLNIALREDAATARRQAEVSDKKYQELRNTTDEYSRQLEKAAELKARDIVLAGISSANRETDRSSRLDKLRTCLVLIENNVAPRGLKSVYIRIKGPDGVLMSGEQQQFAEIEGELMIVSASREVDYQGEDIEVCLYFDNKGFTKGLYTVDVYTSEGKIGSADFSLK